MSALSINGFVPTAVNYDIRQFDKFDSFFIVIDDQSTRYVLLKR